MSHTRSVCYSIRMRILRRRWRPDSELCRLVLRHWEGNTGYHRRSEYCNDVEYHFEVRIVHLCFVDVVIVRTDDAVRLRLICKPLCAFGNTFGTSRKPLVGRLSCCKLQFSAAEAVTSRTAQLPKGKEH